MNEPEMTEEFVRDFKTLFDNRAVVELRLSHYQAWCLMAAIQLAFKHPTGGRTAPVQVASQIARHLQVEIADTDCLKRIAEQGWTER